jgi:hypothetical protein
VFKPVRLTSSVEFVSIADPAIDWDQHVQDVLAASPELAGNTKLTDDDRRRLAERKFSNDFIGKALKDPGAAVAMLKFKNGETPTRFVLGVIPPDDMTRIADECRVGKPNELTQQLQWRSFLHGVREVKGFGEGRVPTRKVGDVEYVDPVWLRDQFARGLRDVALGVGLVVWFWNQITEDEVKN